MNSMSRVKIGFSLVVVLVIVAFSGSPASAQVGSATFDGTYSVPSAGSSGTVSIVFTVNMEQRGFNASFTGPLFGATNPTLNLMTSLDGLGNATFTTVGDPVFGNTTIVVLADGSITWSTTGVADPFTGTGMFATNSLTDPVNSLNLNFVGTNPPMATGMMSATKLPAVPTMPLVLLAVFLGVLLFIAARKLPRRSHEIAAG